MTYFEFVRLTYRSLKLLLMFFFFVFIPRCGKLQNIKLKEALPDSGEGGLKCSSFTAILCYSSVPTSFQMFLSPSGFPGQLQQLSQLGHFSYHLQLHFSRPSNNNCTWYCSWLQWTSRHHPDKQRRRSTSSSPVDAVHTASPCRVFSRPTFRPVPEQQPATL